MVLAVSILCASASNKPPIHKVLGSNDSVKWNMTRITVGQDWVNVSNAIVVIVLLALVGRGLNSVNLSLFDCRHLACPFAGSSTYKLISPPWLNFTLYSPFQMSDQIFTPSPRTGAISKNNNNNGPPRELIKYFVIVWGRAHNAIVWRGQCFITVTPSPTIIPTLSPFLLTFVKLTQHNWHNATS